MDATGLREKLDGDNVLFVPAGENDRDVACDMIAGLDSDDISIIYISVSKPAMTRKEELADRGIDDDRVFFIDGSKSEDKVRQKNVVYVNPANLTDLSISLMQAVESLNEKRSVVVLLDAIESLGLYNDTQTYQQFIHVMCSKLRQHGVPVLLIGTRDSIDEQMQSLITQFTDDTFDPGG